MTPDDVQPLVFVVAGALDQRTGGYLYDARIAAGLGARGREVRVVELPGTWPQPATGDVDSLRTVLAECPDGATVVVDGLVGGAAPAPIEAESGRLRIVALVHHPLADEGDLPEDEVRELEEREGRTLRAANGVIVTSEFTRDRVVEMGAGPDRVTVVEPGTDRPVSGPGTPEGPRKNVRAQEGDHREIDGPVTLLCLGSVVPRKNQAALVRALEAVHDMDPDLRWRCDMVGSLERDRGYAERVMAAAADSPIDDRVRFTDEVGEGALEEIWKRADVLVSVSRYEGYGMALTEAMVRGLPVIAVTGGAVERTVPAEVGRLVPPDDDAALVAALRRVVADQEYRRRLAERSRAYGETLPTWSGQAAAFDETLRGTIRESPPVPHPDDTFDSDWLTLREPADHRARSSELVDRVAAVGTARGWLRVLDLGSGRGSNLRYLGPRLPWARRWTAVDHDAGLLSQVTRTVEMDVRTVRGDLRTEGLAEISRHDLVVASALLDLVTVEWIDVFARRCAEQGAGVLIALTWDGTAQWDEPDPDDGPVMEAVRRHQTGRKGMGVALGPGATQVVADALRATGHEVSLASSPWVLGGEPGGSRDARLAEELILGWLSAAFEILPDERTRLEGWAHRRIERVRSGEFELRVGHDDLLALPDADVRP